MIRDPINSVFRAGLWTLFGITLFVISQRFLFACGFQIGPFTIRQCPADDAQLHIARTRADDLHRDLHRAKIALANKPLCETDLDYSSKKVERDALDKKVRERGGETGKLEVTLSWSTRDDLDLVAYCPGGTIGGHDGKKGPGVCGDGQQNIDANKNQNENVTDDPIEYIRWKDEIPDGRYKFEIKLYKSDKKDISTIPVSLRLKIDDQVRDCRSVITIFPQGKGKKDKLGEVASLTKSLTWSSGDPLPNCSWETGRTHYCKPGECEKH